MITIAILALIVGMLSLFVWSLLRAAARPTPTPFSANADSPTHDFRHAGDEGRGELASAPAEKGVGFRIRYTICAFLLEASKKVAS